MSKPMKPADVDIARINIDPLKKKTYKNGQETKQCRITYDFDNGVKKELNIRVPLATVPYGLSIAKETEGEAPRKFKKYSLDFEVVGTPDLNVFKEKIQELDEKNIDFITANASTWWGKTQSGKPWSRDVVQDSCYGSLLKKTPEEKGDYPERFKLKLPFYEGMPRFTVYDQFNKKVNWVTNGKEGEPPTLDWSWAQRNMRIEAIMECEALWEVNKKVYCTFKAVQVKVYPPSGLKECEFGDAPPELLNENEIPTAEEVNYLNKKSVGSVEVVAEAVEKLKVEDDDEDDDDVEEGKGGEDDEDDEGEDGEAA